MNMGVSPYVEKSKSWLIKSILSNYFKAALINKEIYKNYCSGDDVTFSRLKELSELLYRSKEDLHLIYKRLKDPRKKIFEDVAKCQPTDAEQEFIYNIGLLFHKATIARELQYMLEYYESDADLDYLEIKKSMDDYVERLKHLFQKGASLLPAFLSNFQDDVVILSYFYENQQAVEEAIGDCLDRLLANMDGIVSDSPQVDVAAYFLESGWPERANIILSQALEINPNNERAKKMVAAFI